MVKDNIVILGAGLAGLSAAYHLNKYHLNYTIFEKEKEPGGLCRSKNVNNFTFDLDGHLLHFKERYALNLVKELMDGRLIEHQRNAWVYSHQTFSRYPFQANFFGLPYSIAKDCLLGFIEASDGHLRKRIKSHNFKDWVYNTFGQGIAEHFMIPYNQKFWTVPCEDLSCEWIDRFIPIPTLEETIEGAIAESKRKLGYNAFFWYPIKGGIEEVVLAFVRRIKKINTPCEATKIDIRKKEIVFRDRSKERFNKLITTIPLPEITCLIEDLPLDVKSAIKDLRYTSVFNLNLGIDRDNLSHKHWIYFPEEEFIFYRVGFPHTLSSHSVPFGKSSLYIEVSYSKEKPINKQTIVKRIIEDLIKAGILYEDDKIIAQDTNDIKYGYIIYNHRYQKNTKRILDFLARHNIYSIGRYGAWRYMSMEDAIIDGKVVTDKLSDKK